MSVGSSVSRGRVSMVLVVLMSETMAVTTHIVLSSAPTEPGARRRAM
jgi:hypothetical protein